MRISLLALLLFLPVAALHAQGKTEPVAVPSSTGTPGAIPAPGDTSGYRLIQPRFAPALEPGVLQLLELEGKFQQAVMAGGGKAFATFFADDAVILNNGKPAIQGLAAITTQAQWDPKSYQLTWNPDGAQMGPGGDMGFTWGSYEGKTLGPPVPGSPAATTSGRYMTVWKKLKDGSWKVAMDASADGPPADPACCTVPHP